ncbi:hypothetical protein BD779DRAFT_1632545 [Infundibulicybe gibba]|nr:hypothetical protein BD779DRAFT_1632545 [Infundibulicybe gibba]
MTWVVVLSQVPTMIENSDHNLDPSDETVPGPSLSPTTPHTVPEPSRTQWHSGQPYHHELPGSGNHWKECKDRVDKFDRDFCAGWNSEIDSLLTFAGLFSAVVTAFTVESYQWLQPNPQDVSNQILLNISAQLAGQNITTSTLPPFSPSPSSIRINIFWFLSLIFSLTAGLLGILCKQWLRHYQDDTLPLPELQSFILRQFRYEGLTQWGVKNILDTLPPLLEIGLVLFFIGLIDFLRDLNIEAAVPVVIIIGTGIAFLIVTTMAPAFQYLIYLARRRLAAGWEYIHPRCLHSDHHNRARCCASWHGSVPQKTWTGPPAISTSSIIPPHLRNIPPGGLHGSTKCLYIQQKQCIRSSSVCMIPRSPR